MVTLIAGRVHSQSRNCDIVDVEDCGIDDANYILVNCAFVVEAQKWIFNWCNITSQDFLSVFEFISFAANWGNCPKKKKIWLAICYGLIWCTWKARNEAIFNKTRITPMTLADNVVTLFLILLSIGAREPIKRIRKQVIAHDLAIERKVEGIDDANHTLVNFRKKKKIWLAICYGLIWCTWKARNEAIFNKTRITPMIMADNVVTLVFNFVKHRGKYQNCNWANWICCPFNIV
ncbi:hypothetical protein LXL04_011532 [Taraxacum kok-saghyz]